MTECRFFPWCSYIEDHGCTKDSCRHYQRMPDVDALLELADEMDHKDSEVGWTDDAMPRFARRIREACGEVA